MRPDGEGQSVNAAPESTIVDVVDHEHASTERRRLYPWHLGASSAASCPVHSFGSGASAPGFACVTTRAP